MRIIAGEARGRTLVAPKGMQTRPTSDKTREALFSILMSRVPEAKVLDLFGGTGALALEAISRGAESAVICDKSNDAIESIRRNVACVTKDDGRVTVIKDDYRRALLKLAGKRFDLVFLDPPYGMEEAYTESLKTLFGCDMLEDDAVVVAETVKGLTLTLPDAAEIRDIRAYRDTTLQFIYRR